MGYGNKQISVAMYAKKGNGEKKDGSLREGHRDGVCKSGASFPSLSVVMVAASLSRKLQRHWSLLWRHTLADETRRRGWISAS